MYIYLGDDDITRAAAYLCGIMSYDDIPYLRVNSSQSPPDNFSDSRYDAYVLSDYPCANFLPGQLEAIRDAVFAGAGLIMLGGWESFHGRLGEYHHSPLADVLPVMMLESDDRRNFSQGVLLQPKQPHPILDSLPWENPPLVGGINELIAKPDSQTLLTGIPLEIKAADKHFDFSVSDKTYPLLVVGEYGKGRTAALATDVAPHWVGGFVDWGEKRIKQELPDNNFVEVGTNYVRFFTQLLRWIV
ncbi:hypothetical protein FACS189454_02340 [Planctomycetales bacterium]|nr:hypothetical protein FACS189454_02340 [Planctomycetales bacterium]